MALPDYREGFAGYAQAVATTYEIPQSVMATALGRTPNIGTTQILDVAEKLVDLFTSTGDWSNALSSYTGEQVTVSPSDDIVRHTSVNPPPELLEPKAEEKGWIQQKIDAVTNPVNNLLQGIGDFLNEAKYVALITLIIVVLIVAGLYVLIVKDSGGGSGA